MDDAQGRRIFVRYRDLDAYLTDEFFQCWNVYRISEETGALPFAGGWAEQPEWIVRAIMLLKQEEAIRERQESEGKTRTENSNG